MEWNAALYESRHGFVAEYGKDLLEFVPNVPGQAILDLGCGTGTLTGELAARGTVLGVDASPDMVAMARARFPGIDFRAGDALDLGFVSCFDVVFSNAVFHWIPDHDRLLKNLHRALKPGGLLVCEFGARGNVAHILQAFARALAEQGKIYVCGFTYPGARDFARLLEANRFTCELVLDFDRPTVLADREQGLRNWLVQFLARDLRELDEAGQVAVLSRTEELARNALWNGRAWVADYRRLRVVAHR